MHFLRKLALRIYVQYISMCHSGSVNYFASWETNKSERCTFGHILENLHEQNLSKIEEKIGTKPSGKFGLCRVGPLPDLKGGEVQRGDLIKSYGVGMGFDKTAGEAGKDPLWSRRGGQPPT